ncbi:hypothetical protein BJ878DRAFT_487382 [Calycina marina]|uniref:Protein SSH4 n=1 Tax=Calycina marina TaxID=1763456 RepID=A0A9P8CIN0_9HELO|nr:hypothetical protein BJ878DRAFT_487382 [Calycina marina]
MTSPFHHPSGSAGVPDLSTATGTSNRRRSSYASVVSGAATGPPYPQQSSRNSDFSRLLSHLPDTAHQSVGGYLQHDPRSSSMEYNTNGGSHRRSGPWKTGSQLPSFSSAFGALVNGQRDNRGSHADSFFTPSYLRGSKHVQTLEEAHKAKVLSYKEGQASTSQPGSLSTSASSTSLHTKMAPSHRGMTYDLIEKMPPLEEETLAPLPSKWNVMDKDAGLEVLSEGLEVKFSGSKWTLERDHEASSIRSDHPMPSQCGIYYFEVTVMSRRREDSSIGIGFSAKHVDLTRLPGWEPESWAYHGDDGNTFCCQSTGKIYNEPFTAPDVIGCGVNFRTGSAFFTRNGVQLGIAFREIRGKLYPSIGMKKSGEHIRVNFGQSPFTFDIDSVMEAEKNIIWQQIEATSTAKLAPPLSETELIQSLVLQFLSRDGYVESARALAEELQAEKRALTLDGITAVDGVNVREDEDSVHRQLIRTFILNGEIEKAHQHTDKVYPHVLKSNEGVYFRLRCMRFIEMIRQGAEMAQVPSPAKAARKSNGYYHSDFDDDVINHDMELDDQPSLDKMDIKMEPDEPSVITYNQLLIETLKYGKEIQHEFREDPRREVQKTLAEAFSLMAYADPLGAKKVSHLLDPSGRVSLAEEVNCAILLSLGKSSTAALEQLYQQTTVLLEDLRADGGAGSFVNIDDYVKPDSQNFSSFSSR